MGACTHVADEGAAPGRSAAETWCGAAELDTLAKRSELTERGELTARAEQLAS